MVIRIWCLLICAALSAPVAAQQPKLEATLDRSEIYLGETVKLRVRSTQAALGQGPDYRPLRKDFEVMSPSSNSQMTFSNGVRSVTTEWSVELAPLREGTLSIPALSLDGGQTTEPLALRVLPAPAVTDDAAAQDVYLEVSAEPNDPYVQSQIRLVVKLLYARALTEGTLDEPQPTDAVVQKLGDDVTYQTVRGTRRYMVIERRYAVFPERSGELVVPALRFRGRLTEDGANSRFGSVFNRGRAVALRSDPLTISVRARPANYPGRFWLPARSVTIRDSWSEEVPALRVGEPATRSLTIEAQGLTETQLPESLMGEVAGMRSYPDQPVTTTRTEGVWKYAYREERRAMVPQAEGELTLPAITLHWWDTEADELRVAEVPERRVRVLPAADGSLALAPSELEVVPTNETVLPVAGIAGYWPWVSLAALCGWVMTAIAWWLDRRRRDDLASAKASARGVDAGKHRSLLQSACAAGNAAEAAQALLAWSRAERPNSAPVGLAALSEAMENADLREAIIELDRHLYARDAGEWSGKALWENLRSGMRWKDDSSERSAVRSPLPELYPVTR